MIALFSVAVLMVGLLLTIQPVTTLICYECISDRIPYLDVLYDWTYFQDTHFCREKTFNGDGLKTTVCEGGDCVIFSMSVGSMLPSLIGLHVLYFCGKNRPICFNNVVMIVVRDVA